jgi:hypothetical protein
MAKISFWRRFLQALGLDSAPAVLPPPASPSTGSSSSATPTPARAPYDAPDPLFDDDRIPETSRDRVKLIRTLIRDLEARASERGVISELTELQRIRSAHLPKLLQSYIDIPPEHRSEIFRETGRSASFLLNERLDKMTERLREISALLARGQLNAFAENMRFIDLRYGSSDSPFD